MDILSLPIEIIQLIGNDGQDQNCLRLKTLRLVCSQFNHAFEAQVLSTLVIAVKNNTLKQSVDMLRMFALRSEKTSGAVQYARTLKIKYLSPMGTLEPDPFAISVSQPDEPESQDPSPTSPPSRMGRLATVMSSLKRRFKLMSNDITSAIVEESVKKYLALAISSMKNVETVRWTVQLYDPSWAGVAVMLGLTRLPLLQDLQLILNRTKWSFERSDGYKCIKLDLLSGLKKISLSGSFLTPDMVDSLAGLISKSPQLVHLEVNLGHYDASPEMTSTLHNVLSKVSEDHPLQLTHLALNKTGICIDSFTLPHLRSLISLDLRNLPSSSNFYAKLASGRLEWANSTSTSDTFAILEKEGIHLKHVVVSDVGVFDYLCSYSGLESLDLCGISFDSYEEYNTSARTFYKSVLPQLVHSLQILKIQPEQEGQWCFDPENVFQSVALFQCSKLRSLSVSLNSSSFVQPINFLSRNCGPHRYKDNLDDEISSLINLSFSLPTLSEVCIVIPGLAYEGDVFILGVAEFYRKTVIRLITRSVTNFSLHVGHTTPQVLLPDIWVDEKKLYKYQTLTTQDDVNWERRRYMLTYEKPSDPYEIVDEDPHLDHILQST